MEITNANDVELIIEGTDGSKRGTAQSMGRVVVDEYSQTVEEGIDSVSGVGFNVPAGLSSGDVTYSWSFTIAGDDVDVMDIMADSNGVAKPFSFTARKVDDDGTVAWEKAFDWCKRTSAEDNGSSGDTLEYAVEGIAVSYERE